MTSAREIFVDSETSRIRPFWRGQLLQFDKPQAPTYSAQEGRKLLLVFFLLEVVARPIFDIIARWSTLAEQQWWGLVSVTLVTILGCALVTNFVRVPLSQFGLYSWGRWSKTERLYFLQIVPLTISVFFFFNSTGLILLLSRPNLWEIGLFIFIPKMIWGFYQEFAYRGVLQTELVRRWGSRKGILVSNLVFTFGPLHAYHFLIAQGNPSHLWIFAAIFCIGLFFAILFARSGNLWVIGVMHGLGDWFIDGLTQVASMAS